ncbi:MAG: flagellar motor protein MotD [Sulfuriflexus sp.]|nr:flagellar motor protein MotD [Sulfuriflexus sp.]
MARKKRQEEHVNHERWLVSYADFITLLFAFFVVMYSISSVNEGKYRVLSDTLESAFQRPGKSDKPIQIGRLSRTLNPLNTGAQSPASSSGSQSLIQPIEAMAGEKKNQAAGTDNRADKMLDALKDELSNSLASLLDQNLVTLRKNKDGLEVDLNAKILFQSGSARLSIEAEKLLIRMTGSLSRFPTSMQVEGHTDNTPISSALYPSNWELSSARAATVVNLFAEHEMDPERMWAVGYAQFRPYSTIDTSIEIEQNRRITLVIRPNSAPDIKPARTDKILGTSDLIKIPVVAEKIVAPKVALPSVDLPSIGLPVIDGVGQ